MSRKIYKSKSLSKSPEPELIYENIYKTQTPTNSISNNIQKSKRNLNIYKSLVNHKQKSNFSKKNLAKENKYSNFTYENFPIKENISPKEISKEMRNVLKKIATKNVTRSIKPRRSPTASENVVSAIQLISPYSKRITQPKLPKMKDIMKSVLSKPIEDKFSPSKKMDENLSKFFKNQKQEREKELIMLLKK
jgi:hypothetical protein